MEQTFEEYLKEVKNVHGDRKHKITGSQNTIAGFSYYRKIRPQESKFVLKDYQYLSIIREMNNLLADCLVENKSIRLPSGFGKLEIVKFETKSWIDEGGKFISSKIVDMHNTFKLWHEDEEARLNKIKVRFDEDYIFRIKYSPKGRMYKYNGYFSIKFNRELKHKLSRFIKTSNYDTYLKPSKYAWLKQNGRTSESSQIKY